MEQNTPAVLGPVERMVRPWKWAVREPGVAGMWVGRDSSVEARSTADEWADDGFEPEVVPLYDQAALDAAVAAERERCVREIELMHWMPRAPGRWDETDVAHAEGFNNAKAKALLALRTAAQGDDHAGEM
jgi:hypothetical protein